MQSINSSFLQNISPVAVLRLKLCFQSDILAENQTASHEWPSIVLSTS